MKTKVIVILLFIAFALIDSSMAQKGTSVIKGYVRDCDSFPVVGAQIIIDNEVSNTLTNYDGFYRIRTASDAMMISVLSEARKSEPELIKGRRSIDLKISTICDSSVNAIDIILSDKKRNVTDYSTYRNIYDMIRGRFPGVVVNGKNVRIQGINSWSGNNQPLFIVNGMPLNSIENINPAEVESISLLKGPSTAIYGARGVNGVFVINLKSYLPGNR